MPITKASSSAVAPAAKGDLVVGNATNDSGVLAVGSTDQVLTVDSSTATGLKWATPAAGGMTLLSTTTLAGATTTISAINGAYQDLKVVIHSISPSTAMSINFNINGSATGSYNAGYRTGAGFVGAFTGYGANGTLQVNQGSTVASGNTSNVCVIDISNYASTTMNKYFEQDSIFYSGTAYFNTSQFGMYLSTSAITSFTVTTSTGTFSGGTVLVYGVK